MTLQFPERDSSWRPDRLAPLGLTAGCSQPVAASCLALDQIVARDWSSYGGWGAYADASMRRGWIQHRQRKGLVFFVSMISYLQGYAGPSDDFHSGGGGWLNLVVLPDACGSGSTIEIRGDLNADMYVSVRSVVRSLFVTITRVWDPTIP